MLELDGIPEQHSFFTQREKVDNVGQSESTPTCLGIHAGLQCAGAKKNKWK